MSVVAPGIAESQVLNQSTEAFYRDLQQIHEQDSVLANPAAPADKRALFDYGGYASASYLSLDDLNRKNHSLWQYDLVGYADLNLDNVQDVFLRGRLEWQEFGQGDAFDGRDHQFHATIERAFYKFDLARAVSAYQGKSIDNDVEIKAGRQFVYWANGLALSQTLDAARIDLSHRQTSLEILGGITPAYTVDIDSLRPHFDNNTHRGFYGVMLSQQIGGQKPFAYFVSQQDYNHDYVDITGTGADIIQTHFKYNSNYLGVGSTGTLGDQWTYGFEGVYESGSSFSDSSNAMLAPVKQTKDQIDAFAVDLRVDYLLNDTNQTRLSGSAILASGDDNRRNTTSSLGGAPPNSHDNAYNGFGQVQNGIAFSPNVSNLYIFRVGATTFPLRQVSAARQLQLGEDLFVFQKFSDPAPLDEPSRGRGFVGIEPDLFINWLIKSDITLAMRYGVFFPGHALLSDNVRQFFYTGITFAF